MIIRSETSEDFEFVYGLVKEAFKNAECSDGMEQELVNLLRKSDAFIPELSLVAEIDRKIVGHILFSKAKIDACVVLALAPLSVLPAYQHKGVGTALVEEGHKIAKKLGYAYSIVLGSERYYPRFGYVPAEKYGIKAPFDVPSKNFMAYKIQQDAKNIYGVIKYADVFDITTII